MKYKCTDCGEIFNEEDSGIRKECVGEFWGAPAYMEYNVCPNCNSDCIERYNESEDEDNGDWDGVDAWMPKPEPYKVGGEEE